MCCSRTRSKERPRCWRGAWQQVAEIQRQNCLLSAHFSITLHTQWPGKTAAWEDEWPQNKSSFQPFTTVMQRGHFTAASTIVCLSSVSQRQTERLRQWIEDSSAYINPFCSQMGKSTSGIVLSYSQQGDFSVHVRTICMSQNRKRVCGVVVWRNGRLKKVCWCLLFALPSCQLCGWTDG